MTTSTNGADSSSRALSPRLRASQPFPSRNNGAIARVAQLTASALRLLREQGLAAFLRRLLLRSRAGLGRSRRVSRLGVRLASMWQRPLRLAECDAPDVSIIIPAHDQWSLTYSCLASIVKNRGSLSFEVILVDMASHDRTVKAKEIVRGLRVVRLDSDAGFVDGCNAGASEARGRFLLFSSNDVIMTHGWLEALMDVFATRPRCGVAGGKLVYPNGRLQEAGCIVWRDGTAWNFGQGDDARRPEYNYAMEVDYCSSAALLVRREAFDDAGGFNSAMAPGHWEDVDFCFALRSKGWTAWYQPACVLYHLDASSTRGPEKLKETNAPAFRRRWLRELANQPEFDSGERGLFVARDRRRQSTILVVDHYVPTFDRDAGSLFMFKFLCELADRGCRVILWPDNLFRTPGYTEALQAKGVEVLFGPLSFDDYIRSYGDLLSHVVIYRSTMAEKYLPALESIAATVGYIAVDVEYVREARRMKVDPDDKVSVDALMQRERRIIHAVDCVGVHSPVEAELLRREFGAGDVVELPLPVDGIREATCGPDGREGLLFVGSTHPPNVDAVRYLVNRLYPRMRERIRNLPLRIVGDICDSVRDLAGIPGVSLLGHVEDLAPVFDASRVFVAPVRYGAGIKGKVLEAMNHGVPLVTSTIGAEGIGLGHRETAMIADSDDAFVDSTIELYTDSGLWRTVQAGSLALVRSQRSASVFGDAVQLFLARLQAATATSAGPEARGGIAKVALSGKTGSSRADGAPGR